jgi:hypothetical protein
MEKQKLGLIIAIIILIGIITILSGYIIGLNQNSIENANNLQIIRRWPTIQQ